MRTARRGRTPDRTRRDRARGRPRSWRRGRPPRGGGCAAGPAAPRRGGPRLRPRRWTFQAATPAAVAGAAASVSRNWRRVTGTRGGHGRLYVGLPCRRASGDGRGLYSRPIAIVDDRPRSPAMTPSRTLPLPDQATALAALVLPAIRQPSSSPIDAAVSPTGTTAPRACSAAAPSRSSDARCSSASPDIREPICPP